MKTAISTMLTIILITIACVLSVTYINTHLQISRARDYHASIVDRIEASYFSPTAMAQSQDDAAEKGYELSYKVVSVYEDKKDVLVELKYSITMPLFNVTTNGVIEGYAR